jgi:PAS domain S-box-containing protein
MGDGADRYLEAMGQAAMDLGSEVVFLLERENLRIVQANAAFLAVFGYSREEALGLTLFDLLPVTPAHALEVLIEHERRGERQLGVRQHRRKDGALLDLDVRIGEAHAAGRGLLCVVAHDLTEQRRAEASLRESEERFRVAFQTVPDALTISRAEDGVYVAANEGFTRVSGWPVEEGLGKTALALDLWADPSDREVVQAKLRAEGCLREVEARFKRKDGTPFYGAISGRFMEVGGRRFYLSVTRDITEQKAAAAEQERLGSALRQSEKLSAIGQLAGGVAHDFNNQLTAVLGAAEELVESVSSAQQREMARDILVAATRSAELTRKLLSFARRGQAQRMPVDVHALVAEVCAVLRRSIDRRISVSTRLTAPAAVVLGDSAELQNALLNLALNARDAMPAGGRLSIETQSAWISAEDSGTLFGLAPGRYLQVAVSDTGIGMPREVQARLFEPFFTTKPLGQGTGMGLASVYGAVRAHGGNISVYSEPGKGSSFRLYLPLANEGSAPRINSVDRLPALTPKHVLVVDDEALVREQFGRALRSLGNTVDLAEGGEQALLRFRTTQKSYELVILDVVMPGLGGRETYAALRKLDPSVRVIVTSGFALDGDIQAILDEGARAFLQKPFLRAALVRALLEAAGS